MPEFMAKRVLVQFDGSNFYNKVKRLNENIHLSDFRYDMFCFDLCKSNNLRINYYVGEIKYDPRDIHATKLYSGQQKLFKSLRKQKVYISLGYLLKNNGRFQEKGVDVQIAVDMVDGAADNSYDVCFLISSDTDLIPAIKATMKRGKEVIYVGFENQISIALSRVCSSTMILDKNFINNSHYRGIKKD